MSFELIVDFVGLCLHVRHASRNEVAVVLPDARSAGIDTPMNHIDDSAAQPHVGYLRMSLASLMPASAGQGGLDADDPAFEVVHRLSGQTLNFNLSSTESPISVEPCLPHLDCFSTALGLLAGVFGPTPPDSPWLDERSHLRSLVLARTLLQGGSLGRATSSGASSNSAKRDIWSIDQRLSSRPTAPYQDEFEGDVRWRREVVDQEFLRLTIMKFDGSDARTLDLYPDVRDGKRELRLKIANLCADNPLEWSQLAIHRSGLEDSDFKWMYRLLQPSGGQTWAQLLGGFLLPAPRLVREKDSQAFGYPRGDCSGLVARADFPPIETWDK